MTTGIETAQLSDLIKNSKIIEKAEKRKQKDEEFKKVYGIDDKTKSNNINKLRFNESTRKPSSDLTKEGYLKILIEQSKPSSIEKDNTAENANMMAAIANVDASNKFVEAIKGFSDTIQTVQFSELMGKEIEVYKPLSPQDAEKYLDHPEERPVINGILVDITKEREKTYLHIELNPGSSKDDSKIIKVERGSFKKQVLNSTLEKQNKYKGLSGAKETKQLLGLVGQTISAYVPFELPPQHHGLKEHIDLKDRPVITGKVVNVVKETVNKKDTYFFEIKRGDEIIKINVDDMIEIVDFNQENLLEEMLFKNQLLEAIELKGKEVEMFTDKEKSTTVKGKVLNISMEKPDIYLTLEQENGSVKINFNDFKKI